MQSMIIRPPHTDEKGNVYEFKILKSSKSDLSDLINKRMIDISLATKYLIALKKYPPKFYPKRYLAIKNDRGGYSIHRENENFNTYNHPISCIKQSITSFIRSESSTIMIFYNFWDFLSYLSLYPDQEEQNFLILNRHTPHDHNLAEAKLIAGRFATVENYVKWNNAKNEEVQKQLEEVCKQVIPRWKEFDEPNFNEYYIKKIASN